MNSNQRLYVVAINHYYNPPIPSLETPTKDAKALSELLNGKGYSCITLNDGGAMEGHATRDDIKNFILRMQQEVESDDRVVFYYAGHGETIEDNEVTNGYLLSSEAGYRNPETWLPMSELLSWLEGIQCNHFLLLLDCCFAGSIKWATGKRSVSLNDGPIYKEQYDRFLHYPAWQALVSAAYDQKALDVERREKNGEANSPFAKALLEGLGGAADNPRDGVITVTELYLHVRDSVEKKEFLNGKKFYQTPLLVQLDKHDKGEYIFLTSDESEVKLSAAPNYNPYNNELSSYAPADYRRFYGRKAVTDKLTREMPAHCFRVITGVSGSGKSSIIKAGVIPAAAINYDGKPVGPQKKTVDFVPAADSLVITPTEDWFLTKSKMERLLQSKSPAILVVDQFEEIVTQIVPGYRTIELINVLDNWLDKKSDSWLFLVVRSDYEFEVRTYLKQQYGNVHRKSNIVARWNDAIFPLPWFSREELREIIVEPFFKIAYQYETSSLVDEIIDSVMQYPGALPFLSLALSLLYETVKARDQIFTEAAGRKIIKRSDYDEIEGVYGSLHHKTNDVVSKLKKTNSVYETALKLILPRLVTPDLNSKRKVMKSEVDQKACIAVIEMLFKERILTGDGYKDSFYYEFVHDSVINKSIFRTWLDEIGIKNITLLDDIRVQSNKYKLSYSPEGMLWDDDPRLDDLERTPGLKYYLNNQETEFINKSHQLRADKQKKEKQDVRKRKNNRRIIVAIALLLVIIGGLAVFLSNENKKEKRRRITTSLYSNAGLYPPSDAIRMLQSAYLMDSSNADYQQALINTYRLSDYEVAFSFHSINFSQPVKDYQVLGKPDRIFIRDINNNCFISDGTGRNVAPIGVFTSENIIFSKDNKFVAAINDDHSYNLFDANGRLVKQFKSTEPFHGHFTDDGKNFLLTYLIDELKLNVTRKISVFNLGTGNLDSILLRQEYQLALSVEDAVKYIDELQELIIHGIPARQPERYFISVFSKKGYLNRTFAGDLVYFDENSKNFIVQYNNSLDIISFDMTRAKRKIKPDRLSYNFLLSPKGNLLYATNGEYFHLWKTSDGSAVVKRPAIRGCTDRVFFSTDETRLLKVTDDSLFVFRTKDGSLEFHLEDLPKAGTEECNSRILRAGNRFIIKGLGREVVFDLDTLLLKSINSHFESSHFATNSGDSIAALVDSHLSLHFLKWQQFGSDISSIVYNGFRTSMWPVKNKIALESRINGELTHVLDPVTNSIKGLSEQERMQYSINHLRSLPRYDAAKGEVKVTIPQNKSIQVPVGTLSGDDHDWTVYYGPRYNKLLLTDNDELNFLVDYQTNRTIPLSYNRLSYYYFFGPASLTIVGRDGTLWEFQYSNGLLNTEKRLSINWTKTNFNNIRKDKPDSLFIYYPYDTLYIKSIVSDRQNSVVLKKKIDYSFFSTDGNIVAVLPGRKFNLRTYVMVSRSGQIIDEFEDEEGIYSLFYSENTGKFFYLKNGQVAVKYLLRGILKQLNPNSIPPLSPRLAKTFGVKIKA